MTEEIKISPVEKPAEKNELEMFAEMFHTLLPQFDVAVQKMSNKMLRRLIMALIEVPLNQKEYNPTTAFEKNAFIVGDRLLQIKSTIVLHLLAEEMEEKKRLQEENKEKENVGA